MSIFINIIIPCYYSSEKIRPCFKSLANQTYKNIINIIMVNDCSPNTNCEYLDIREEFVTQLSITYVRTPNNLGPGGARQYGLNYIDNNAPYVMFIDDDDCLFDNYVIEHYYNKIINKTNTQIYAQLAGRRIFAKNNNIIDINQEVIQYTGLTGSIFNYNIISMFNLVFKSINYDEDSIFFIQYNFYCKMLEFYLFNFSFELIQEKLENYCYIYTTDNFESLTHKSDYRDNNNNVGFLSLINITNEILSFYLNHCNYYPQKQIIMNDLCENYYVFVLYYTQFFLTQKEKFTDEQCQKAILRLNLQLIKLLGLLDIQYIDTNSPINQANIKYYQNKYFLKEFIGFNSIYDYFIFIYNIFLSEGKYICLNNI